MLITQIESSPIGDTFHDSGILKVVEKLTKTVDKFEIETEDVNNYCDYLITQLKNLKAVTKKAETEYRKVITQKEIGDSVRNYI